MHMLWVFRGASAQLHVIFADDACYFYLILSPAVLATQILNFSGNNDVYDEQYGKPILWAKDYEKFKQEKEAKKNAPPAPKGKGR